MKKRLDIRVEAELRDGLDQRAEQTGQRLTAIVERNRPISAKSR